MPGTNPCPKQGQLGQVAPDNVQMGFESIQGWMKAWQSAPVFDHPHVGFSGFESVTSKWVPLPQEGHQSRVPSTTSKQLLEISEMGTLQPLHTHTGYLYTWTISPFICTPRNLNGRQTSDVKHLEKSLLFQVFNNLAYGKMHILGLMSSGSSACWWEGFNSHCFQGFGKWRQ